MKKIIKPNNSSIKLISALLIFFIILATSTIMILLKFHNNAKSTLCSAYAYQLGKSLQYYYDVYHSYPCYYSSKKEEELWSWRSILIERGSSKIDFASPWNSEYNLAQLSNYNLNKYFTCPFMGPSEERASYVAVTGPGTVWTEASNGKLKHPEKYYPDMILAFETSEPKNKWMEPGDDATPSDVIRLFLSDPGLVKCTKQSFFKKGHCPKYYIRVDGSTGKFDQINSLQELKNLLIVPKIILETNL